MAQQKTSLDIWFSYAGEQQSLVTSIVDYMTANEDDLRETVFNLDDETDFTALKGVRFLPKRYKSEDEKDKPHFRLPPSGDINALVEDIGKSFIKVIVLSKDYFKSPVCMRELCVSLCGFHIKRGVFPLFLLVGFKNTENFFTAQTFKFQLKPNSSPVTKTLADALRIVHEDLEESEWKKVRGFDVTSSARDTFQSTLKSIEDRVFTEGRLFFNSEKIFLAFRGRRSRRVAHDLSINLYRYSLHNLKDLSLSYHRNTMEKLYSQWRSTPFAAKLVNALGCDSENKSASATNFLHLETTIDASRYISQIKTALGLFKYKKDEAISSVLSLLGLIALQLTPTLDAALFAYFGGANAVLEIKVESSDSEDFIIALQNAMAFSMAVGIGVRFQLVKPNHDLLVENIKGIVFAKNLNASSDHAECIGNTLSTLVRQFLPSIHSKPININALTKEDKKVIRNLRREIAAFQESRRNNEYSSLVSSNYGFVACKKVVKNSHASINQFVTQIEDILNDEFEDQTRLPYITFSEHSLSSKQANFSVKMSRDISEFLEIKLLEICLFFQGKTT